MLESNIVLLIFAFMGTAVLTYVFSCSIEKLKIRAIEEMRELKSLKTAEYDKAKNDLKALIERKKDLEIRLQEVLAKQMEEGQNGRDGVKLSVEDWLLKEGHLTLEQLSKARQVIKRTNLAMDAVSTCILLGFISEGVAKEAVRMARGEAGCQ